MARPAPLLLLAYNRPAHTQRCLRSLAANPDMRHHPLYVYSDGPRTLAEAEVVHAVRRTVREEAPGKKLVLVERPSHLGLAASVIAAVNEVMDRHGQAIVLEDDLELSPAFLKFMQAGLERYAKDPRVMQVSGYMFPIGLSGEQTCPFLPMISSWGWATWARAWRHFDPDMAGLNRLRGNRQLRRRFDLEDSYPFFSLLEQQAIGQADSWAVRWYLSVFQQQGLTLFPPVSLVRNRGWDGSGTHCTVGNQFDTPLARLPGWHFPEELKADAEVLARLQNFFRKVVPTQPPRPPLVRRLWSKMGRFLGALRIPRARRAGKDEGNDAPLPAYLGTDTNSMEDPS